MDKIDSYSALNLHWLVWKVNGVERPKNINVIIYTILRLIILIFGNFMFPTTLILNLFFTTTLDDICDNLNMTSTAVTCSLKAWNMYIVRDKIKNIKNILNYLDSRSLNEKEKKEIKNSIKITNLVFKTLFCSYGSAVILSILVPLVAVKRTLMYPAWFPLDWKNSKSDFIVITIYQATALSFLASQNVANDSYPMVFFNIIAAHIKTLAYRIRKIGNNKNKSIKENYDDLKQCIDDHRVILRLYRKSEEIISIGGIAQFIGSGIVQCTAAIYLLKPNILAKQFLAYAIFTAVTTEVFLLCFFGNILTVASEDLSRAIYECNWVGESKEFRRNLILFIKQSQELITVKAGHYIDFSLPTFVTTVKTAYSFFAVLNSVN